MGLLLWTLGHADSSKSVIDSPPESFVVIDQHIPGIKIQLSYSSDSNFTGKIVSGYENGKCWITREAAEAIGKVQKELQSMGLSLLIFDAFRPQKAVDSFVDWAKDSTTSRNEKLQYFPNIEKSELFTKGYIADKSGHTRGSTVDLTICAIDQTGKPVSLDMGTPFDFFGEEAGTTFKGVTSQQRANRLLLKSVMEKYGFKNYPVEWWHFTLKNEPYPDTYFNFSISD
ncbi:M15 family metallopeptidase [bacterium]|nr:M15 family metallopeptidase [bacterium]